MAVYKLFYFEFRGMAEVSRLMLYVSGVQYEDIRYSDKEWPSHKHEMPMKKMPVLEVGGKRMCQNNAITRYLARELGFYGSNSWEAFQIDEIHECLREVIPYAYELHYCKDDELAKQLLQTVEERLQTSLLFIEKRLKENKEGLGYLVGDTLSVADLLVMDFVQMINAVIGNRKPSETFDCVADFRTLKAFCQRIEEEPKVAEWLQKRPPIVKGFVHKF